MGENFTASICESKNRMIAGFYTKHFKSGVDKLNKFFYTKTKGLM